MAELGQHIILRLEDDRVIAPTAAARRILARAVLEVARPHCPLAFNGVDTHLHLETAGSGAQASELARRLKLSLVPRLGLEVGFAPARIKPILDQHHLRRTFAYILRQHDHHGYDEDPHHDASNLPDLLGLRLVGGYTAANVRSLLPRVRRADLLAALGLSSLESPAEIPLALLADAAAAAAALPALTGRSVEVVEARRAAVHVAGDHHDSSALARALGCSPRTIRRLRSEPALEPLTRAVALQLHLRVSLPRPELRLLAAVAEADHP
jgi:hypothetical protein